MSWAMGTVSLLFQPNGIYYLDLPKCLTCAQVSQDFLSIWMPFSVHLLNSLPTIWGHLHHTPSLNSSFIYSLIQRLCLEHLPPSGSVPGTGDVLVVKTHMSSDLIELSFLGKTDTKQIYKYMYNYHVSCVHWRKRTGCSENEQARGK